MLHLPRVLDTGTDEGLLADLWCRRLFQSRIWDGRHDSKAEWTSTKPKIWSMLSDISSFIDTAMHHLFHGITDNVMKAILKVMTEHSLLATFEKTVNDDLDEIASFQLDWCKMKKLPKKQWLAEDLLGFSHVMPFVYGQFFLKMNMPDHTTYNG